jgi:hypothetical protein
MAHRRDDRWLWLGTAALLIIAFKSISYAIHDTVRLTEVEPLTTKEQDEDQQRQPEDCTQQIPITTQKPSSPISNTTSQPQP